MARLQRYRFNPKRLELLARQLGCLGLAEDYECPKLGLPRTLTYLEKQVLLAAWSIALDLKVQSEKPLSAPDKK